MLELQLVPTTQDFRTLLRQHAGPARLRTGRRVDRRARILCAHHGNLGDLLARRGIDHGKGRLTNPAAVDITFRPEKTDDGLVHGSTPSSGKTRPLQPQPFWLP